MDCRQETEGGTRNGRGKRRRHTDGLQTRNRRRDKEWKGEETQTYRWTADKKQKEGQGIEGGRDVDIKMDCRQETEGETRNGGGKRRRHTDGMQTRNRRRDKEWKGEET
jgi:hypothetical protein